MKELITEIQKLQLRRGDILCLKVERVMAQEVKIQVRETLQKLIPQGIPIAIMEPGCEFQIIRQAEAS